MHRARRTRHEGERGLTLIEMIVTIAVMTIGIVGITGALAQTEKLAGITQQQANLDLVARQLADYVRDTSGPTSATGLGYKYCANTTSNAYTLPAAPTGYTWKITAVQLSTGATRQSASGLTANIIAKASCGTIGGVAIGDWGVQKITVAVSASTMSVTRTVWKSDPCQTAGFCS
jgi:prepilin-type N-terminal cleavage/methylation domain-containing protein